MKIYQITVALIECSVCVLLLFEMIWSQGSYSKYSRQDYSESKVKNSITSHSWQDERTGLNNIEAIRRQLVSDSYTIMRNSSTLDGYNAIETQEMRQRLISAVCRQKSVNYTDHAKHYSHIFVIDEYKFMYCAVRKVASITWKHVIDDLKRTSKRGSEVRRRLLSSYTDDEIQQRLKFYKKFMFVREPLQRVFSAWKDKFQSTNRFVKSEFEHMVGPLIVKKIRQENLPRDFGILFSQRTPNLNVTFVEFVRYLTEVVQNVEEEDMHWNPYHHRCHPCHVQYDFIGHYETLKADADELLRELQISHLVKFPVGQSSSSSQAVQHYTGIEDTVVERLAGLYRLDYEIFGYSIKESLKLLKL